MQMSKYFQIILVLLCTVIIMSFDINAENTKSVNIDVINSNSNNLKLKFANGDFLLSNIDTKTAQTVLPKIGGTFLSETPSGSPSVIISTALFLVPSQDGFELKNVKLGNIKSIKGLISPVPFLGYDKDIAAENYIVNQDYYSGYKQMPWVSIRYLGISRGNYLAQAEFVSAQYNSESKSIDFLESAEIEIAFKSEKTSPQSSKIKTNYLTNALNKEFAGIWNTENDAKTLSAVQDLNTLSSGNWFKIKIEKEGLYKITAADLSAKGAQINADLAKTVKIFVGPGTNITEKVILPEENQMSEEAVIVNKGTNGEFESLIFYANAAKGFEKSNDKIKHYQNSYSNFVYAFVTWGGSEGKRAVFIPEPTGNAVNIPAWYTERIFFDEDLYMPFPEGSGRYWFGRTSMTPVTDILPNINYNSEESIKYVISAAHTASTYGVYNVSLNGSSLTTIGLSGVTSSYGQAYRGEAEVNVPVSRIEQDGRSVLNFTYTNQSLGAAAFAYFDFYEIHYPRELVPNNNSVGFWSDNTLNGITEYRFNGFSGNALGLDVTDPENPRWLTNTAQTGGMYHFKVNSINNEYRKYYISANMNTAILEKVEMKNLHGTNEDVDVIVITDKSTAASAQEYADYRQSITDKKFKVFFTEDIYNEFGNSIPDVMSIRHFISNAYFNWSSKPFYVLLWGDTHYDFRNIQIKKPLLVPTYQEKADVQAYNDDNSFSTDDYYVIVDGNDAVIDMAIGRVPCNSDAQGRVYTQKVKDYLKNSSNDDWRTNILLMADDSWTTTGRDGSQHSSNSEAVCKYIPNGFNLSKLYLVEYPPENIPGGKRKPRAAEELVNRLTTSGAVLFNWTGHGNPRVMAHEQVFVRETTIPQLNNYEKLFFLVAATCDFGRFDMDAVNSSTEDLMFSKIGGSIGALAASRLVVVGSNSILNNYFYDDLLRWDSKKGKYNNLGTALFLTKQRESSGNGKKYYLFADPTLQLDLPNQKINITKINNINIDTLSTSNSVELSGLQRVVVEGNILTPDSTINTDFNGSIILTLFDGDEAKSVKDEDNSVARFTEQGGKLNKSTFKVESGIFEAEFVVPKDISYSDNTARLFAYAFSNDSIQFAQGAISQIKISGLDTSTPNDGKGPKVDIYLDGRQFLSGDKVRENPLLIVDMEDETGINSAGLGLGHDIEVWIDGSPNSIILTSRFSTSLTNPKAGSVQTLLFGLKPGLHSIKARAWDVFNNFTVSETQFRIPGENLSEIREVYLIPNPLISSGIIRFEHNITPAFEAEIDIFNEAGIRVSSIKQNMNSLHTSEVNWDARSQDGNLLPQGAYYYHIKATDSKGTETEAKGVLGIIVR